MGSVEFEFWSVYSVVELRVEDWFWSEVRSGGCWKRVVYECCAKYYIYVFYIFNCVIWYIVFIKFISEIRCFFSTMWVRVFIILYRIVIQNRHFFYCCRKRFYWEYMKGSVVPFFSCFCKYNELSSTSYIIWNTCRSFECTAFFRTRIEKLNGILCI